MRLWQSPEFKIQLLENKIEELRAIIRQQSREILDLRLRLSDYEHPVAPIKDGVWSHD